MFSCLRYTTAGLLSVPFRNEGEAQSTACCSWMMGASHSHFALQQVTTVIAGGGHAAFLRAGEKAEAEKLKEVSENLCKSQE